MSQWVTNVNHYSPVLVQCGLDENTLIFKITNKWHVPNNFASHIVLLAVVMRINKTSIIPTPTKILDNHHVLSHI